ncbi:MAG: hypothetical protein ACK4IU_05190 [Tabrizicola flagellatus]|uniref:hypothetical protein n=1 Tax=Tabrizicola flagellatus TaxID=2593021 RepID=UPI00391C4E0C
MPRPLSLAVLMVCATTLLSACQLTGAKGPAAAGQDVTANAVTGDPIEAKALDAPPAAGGAAATTATGTGTQAAAPGPAVAPADAAAPAPAAEPAAPAEPALAAKPEPVAPVVPAKSEAQIACEKKGGTWYKVGKGEKRACVRQTRDSGKRCERESQCEGVCLARSGTCSPFKPMYGCNEIFQDNGARVTLCLD